MKKINTLIEDELNELVIQGNQFIQMACRAENNPEADVRTSSIKWISRSGLLLNKIYNKDSFLINEFNLIVKDNDFTTAHLNYYDHFCKITGILQSAIHEIKSGLLFDLRKLIQADIFADFLEMAEFLLAEGYKDAAAVIIGGVLEDSLRKLAIANGISTANQAGKPLTMEPLNDNLYKSSIYGKLSKKQITSWGELRNSAAHANYDNYDSDQVKMMLLFVQKFCDDYLI